MKLTIQYHSGNPDICRIPELKIRHLPECEGGGWWMPRRQAEDILSFSTVGTELTEEMEQAGFDAIEEYDTMKAAGVLPRPSLISHIWHRMVGAVTVQACTVCGNEERGQGGYLTCECPLQSDFGTHDCGEDVCVCADGGEA